jgi:glycosyltransferase involved in cell wall biosynthesis
MSLRLLVIAYYYPPRGGGGVQRTAKFVKYLPEFGITPMVLTSASEGSDASLAPRDKDFVLRVAVQEPRGALFRLLEMLQSPDPYVAWAKPAIEQGLALAKKLPIDVIYSTASPYTNHLVGMRLAQKLGKPWIADFRDLWTENALYKPRAPWQRMRHRTLEQAIYSQASHILTTSPTQQRVTMQKFGVPANRISMITNGFDPEDFKDLKAKPKKGSNTFVIGYLGSFYGSYQPRDFLEGLRLATMQQPNMGIKLLCVGDVDRKTRVLLQDPRYAAFVEYRAYVPHAQLARVRAEIDGNLLYLPAASQHIAAMIPQKVFEYLASKKPILAVVPPSDVADILARTGGAVISRAGDTQKIAHDILTFVQRVKTGQLAGATNDISMYSRKSLTKKLADIVTNLAGHE